MVVSASNTLLVCDSNTVYSLDASDADLATVLGTWDSHGGVRQVAIHDSYAYVANGEQGVAILTLPALTLETQIQTPGQAYDVDGDDTCLCVADGTSGIQIYHLSQDTGWSHAATLVVPGTAHGVRLQEQTLFAAGDFGVWMIDVSIPYEPVLLAQSTLPVNALGTAQQGKDIVVADPNGGLLVLEIP